MALILIFNHLHLPSWISETTPIRWRPRGHSNGVSPRTMPPTLRRAPRMPSMWSRLSRLWRGMLWPKRQTRRCTTSFPNPSRSLVTRALSPARTVRADSDGEAEFSRRERLISSCRKFPSWRRTTCKCLDWHWSLSLLHLIFWNIFSGGKLTSFLRLLLSTRSRTGRSS